MYMMRSDLSLMYHRFELPRKARWRDVTHRVLFTGSFRFVHKNFVHKKSDCFVTSRRREHPGGPNLVQEVIPARVMSDANGFFVEGPPNSKCGCPGEHHFAWSVRIQDLRLCSPPFLVIVPRGGGGDHVSLELGPAVPKLPVRMRAVLGKQRVPVKNPVPRPQQPYDRQILLWVRGMR